MIAVRARSSGLPSAMWFLIVALWGCGFEHAPEVAPIADQTNSAQTLETVVVVYAIDVDGDPLEYAVAVSDPAVATATVDSTGTLALTPRALGATEVDLTVSDGKLQTTAKFTFTISEAKKLRHFTVGDPRSYAVSIWNTLDRDVAFELRHNGALLATTGDQLVQEAWALADEVAGESFGRKLWRFVRDGRYGFEPLTAAYWQHDPLLFLNSVGFGYCDDVSAVYASLARTALYFSRVWDLTGHAVPEIWEGWRWAMYDPDLAVYYQDANGQVASVAELEADPSLIMLPNARLLSDPFPYSSFLADIYATIEDNLLLSDPFWDSFFVPPRDGGALQLPPNAGVTYPGLWSTMPAGIYGTPVTVTAQLRLDLPAGYAGVIDWPLVPWDVQGAGRVRWNGADYVAGSLELTAALQNVGPHRSPPSGLEVVEATGPLSIVYLLNPMRFSLSGTINVEVRSLDAWALTVALVPQDPTHAVAYDSTDSVVWPR